MLALALASLVLGAETHLELDAGIRGENRMAVLRANPAQPAVRTFNVELTPNLHAIANKGPWRFDSTYSTQLLLQNAEQNDRPLVLHRGRALLERYTKRGDVMRLQLDGLAGEIDYGRATRFVTEEGAGLLASFPDEHRIVNYASGDAVASVLHRHDRRHSTGVTLAAGYTGPTPGEPGDLVLRQRRVNLLTQHLYEIDARSVLAAEMALARVVFTDGPSYIGVVPGTSLTHRLSRTDQLTLRVAVQLTYTSPAPTPDVPDPVSGLTWMPLGIGTWRGVLSKGRRATLQGESSVGVTPYYDPFRADLLPRALVTSALTLDGPSRFTSVARVSFYSTINRGAVRNTNPDAVFVLFGQMRETLVTASLNIRRPILQSFMFELGGVLTARQEQLPAKRFLRSPEYLGYGALSANLEVWN